MRIQVILLTLVLGIFPFSVIAGAGHDHDDGHSHDPVSQSTAEQNALKKVANLVEKGKIDKSWKTIGVAKSEQKEFSGHKEWVVSFKNSNISDSSKQTLYVFLRLTGEYIAANYTGK